MSARMFNVGLALMVALSMVLPSVVVADDPAYFYDWEAGDEMAVTGHQFSEEMWTSDPYEIVTPTNDTAAFTFSYVNHEDVQAFLVALHHIENQQNGTGVLPYQLFGMHYFTPQGNEVFLAAQLAFLFAYRDLDGDGIPEQNEHVQYIIPFGASALVPNVTADYVPEVDPITVTKLAEGHYRFGMTYRNLYAFVAENPIAAAILKTGFVAKFSELSVTYDIEFHDDGRVTTETFYTIGQVTELYTFLLGFPIPANDVQATIADDMTIGAAHFTTVFTSKYSVAGPDGTDLTSGIQERINGTIEVRVGDADERAFSLGVRGDFDLIDETAGDAVVASDQAALNAIIQAKPMDLLLVAWQLGFSAHAFSIFAYGLSEDVRAVYDSPSDLANRSLAPFNPTGFSTRAFWYAVMFPGWDGYRVVHDPVYTMYTRSGSAATTTTDDTTGDDTTGGDTTGGSDDGNTTGDDTTDDDTTGGSGDGDTTGDDTEAESKKKTPFLAVTLIVPLMVLGTLILVRRRR